MNLGLRYKYTQICTVHIQEKFCICNIGNLGNAGESIPTPVIRSLIHCRNEAINSTREGYNGIIKLYIKSSFLLLHPPQTVARGSLKRRLGRALKASREEPNPAGAAGAPVLCACSQFLSLCVCECSYVQNTAAISSV